MQPRPSQPGTLPDSEVLPREARLVPHHSVPTHLMFGLEAGEMNLLGETPKLLSSPEAPSGCTGEGGVSKAKVVGICLLALAPPGELPTRTFKGATKSMVLNNQELCLMETTLPPKNGPHWRPWHDASSARRVRSSGVCRAI